MESLRKKNLVGVVGGMIALLGMFLPYVEGASFFQSLSGPEYGFFAPGLTLMIALATALYALRCGWFPWGISVAVFVICGAFPGYACLRMGIGAVLPLLRAGAWALLGGLLAMTLHPLLQRAVK